ncbi:MAG: hypothetical protein Fur0025_00830 [Oscillatoriaceae cyanobacterium]
MVGAEGKELLGVLPKLPNTKGEQEQKGQGTPDDGLLERSQSGSDIANAGWELIGS